MKTKFKARYFHYLSSKQQMSEGFTLIELLVTIIIVGVLSATALPGFLNQVAKARHSEAKANIGTINRAQQTYRNENGSFAPALTNLDARVSGKFYTYTLGAGATAAAATVEATATGVAAAAELKTYAGAVAQTGDFFSQIICESTSVNGTVPTPQAPNSAASRGVCINGINLD
jgi:type IV pilus assembly protein PilA